MRTPIYEESVHVVSFDKLATNTPFMFTFLITSSVHAFRLFRKAIKENEHITLTNPLFCQPLQGVTNLSNSLILRALQVEKTSLKYPVVTFNLSDHQGSSSPDRGERD